MMSKPNLDNVPLQELVANNVEGIDVVKFRGTLYLEMHEAHAELAILWEDV
jgi:hypothetical protein